SKKIAAGAEARGNMGLLTNRVKTRLKLVGQRLRQSPGMWIDINGRVNAINSLIARSSRPLVQCLTGWLKTWKLVTIRPLSKYSIRSFMRMQASHQSISRLIQNICGYS